MFKPLFLSQNDLNKSIGHDNITAFPLKNAATITALYMQRFFDFSFSRGILPENGSLANVFPTHKKATKMIQAITGQFSF